MEITPEIQERIDRNRDRYKAVVKEEDERWANELVLLERRVKENIIEIELGDGDTIAIHGSLSEMDMKRIQRLTKDRDGMISPGQSTSQLDDPTLDQINDITYEILGIVTANPYLTKEWFVENPDKFSTEDMLVVVLEYFDRMAERADRVKNIKSFRTKQERPELRSLPALHEDDTETVR